MSFGEDRVGTGSDSDNGSSDESRRSSSLSINEFLIDPILLGRAPRPLAPAPRGEPVVEADDDDDRMAPLDPLPATSSDEKPEDASDADVPKLFEYFTPPRYPSPPPMIDHYAFQHGARVDGADVAVEDSSQQQEQLSELINGLNIRKRPFEDNVEPQHEGSTTEEEMIPKKRILRLPHWAINNKKAPLRAKSGGGSATEQDGDATPIEHEVQQPDLEAEPAVTSGEHTSDDSTIIAAALNHLSIDTLEAGLTPDQVAAAIAQLYISRHLLHRRHSTAVSVLEEVEIGRRALELIVRYVLCA